MNLAKIQFIVPACAWLKDRNPSEGPLLGNISIFSICGT